MPKIWTNGNRRAEPIWPEEKPVERKQDGKWPCFPGCRVWGCDLTRCETEWEIDASRDIDTDPKIWEIRFTSFQQALRYYELTFRGWPDAELAAARMRSLLLETRWAERYFLDQEMRATEPREDLPIPPVPRPPKVRAPRARAIGRRGWWRRLLYALIGRWP